AATVLHLRPGAHVQTVVLAMRELTDRLGAQSALASDLRCILCNSDFATELVRRFDADRPDFIYERASLHGTAGATVARALRVPLLLELNAPLALEQSAYRSQGLGDLAAKAERWSLAQADAVLAVSEPL